VVIEVEVFDRAYFAVEALEFVAYERPGLVSMMSISPWVRRVPFTTTARQSGCS